MIPQATTAKAKKKARIVLLLCYDYLQLKDGVLIRHVNAVGAIRQDRIEQLRVRLCFGSEFSSSHSVSPYCGTSPSIESSVRQRVAV